MFSLIFVSFVCAFDPLQEQLFHQLTAASSGVNPFVTLQAAPIADELAYTTPDRSHIYMDMKRLQSAPHTFYNVLRHEIAHTKGAEHNDGTVEMSYAATIDTNGVVIDDGFLI